MSCIGAPSANNTATTGIRVRNAFNSRAFIDLTSFLFFILLGDPFYPNL